MERIDPAEAWLRVAQASAFGTRRIGDAVAALGGVPALARASRRQLIARLGASRGGTLHARLSRANPAALRREARRCELRVLTPEDDEWPTARFEGMSDAPLCLFVRGTLPAAGTPALGVVGTRRATASGLDTARSLTAPVARAGACIVSGFALGIDAAAHESALATPGGTTVAVLGAGIDVSYPTGNAHLRERLVQSGAFVSEYGPGTRPGRHTFPRRNRIIAALSDVVVVIEAPERSGALITARIALELHREVFAVPGHVRRTNQAGCHALLKEGKAAMCTEPEDLLRALQLTAADHPARRRELSGHESAVLEQLDPDQACDLDTLSLGSGLSPSAVTIALTHLELAGLAKRIPGVGYLST